MKRISAVVALLVLVVAAAMVSRDTKAASTKVQVCHLQGPKPVTLSISIHAVDAHIDHGDSFGPCD